MKVRLKPVVFGTLALFAVVGPVRTTEALSDPNIQQLVIGHRGLGQNHAPEPENSIPSIVAALKRGASAVEFDVQLSKDGQVILAHDVVLDRISDGRGCVAEHSFQELEQIHPKDGLGVVHPDLTFPTFEEALDAIAPLDSPERVLLADIHVKAYQGIAGDWAGPFNKGCPFTKDRELIKKVLTILKKKGLEHRVILTSFYPPVLDYISVSDPSLATGLLGYFDAAEQIRKAKKNHYKAVVFQKKRATAEFISLAHEAGLRAFVWTTAGKAENEQAFKNGIDGVITDTVDEALAARP